jgi:SPP1 family phage portal protein
LSVNTTVEGSKEIVDGENYPAFPIVPLFANEYKQSALVGLREGIDCYDLIKSGFCDDLSDAAQIYWILQNAGGMSEVDLARFVERLKTTHAVNVDDGVSAEAHTTEVPFESREALLDRISKDLYRDAMALNVQDIITGATTATQIRAAYELLTEKCDRFEYFIRDFIDKILFLADTSDEEPTFTRSFVINKEEEIRSIVEAASYLSDDYVTKKILTILGDIDLADSVVNAVKADALGRLSIDE